MSPSIVSFCIANFHAAPSPERQYVAALNQLGLEIAVAALLVWEGYS